eukprot:5231666-Amphidinium_carterae.1
MSSSGTHTPYLRPSHTTSQRLGLSVGSNLNPKANSKKRFTRGSCSRSACTRLAACRWWLPIA